MPKNDPIQAAVEVLKGSPELAEALVQHADSLREILEIFTSNSRPSGGPQKNGRKKPYKCWTCGEYGHNSRTCANTLDGDPAPSRKKTQGVRKKTQEELDKAFEQRYPGISELLGQFPDSEVARRYGLSERYVHKIRVTRGVPAFRPLFAPTPEFSAALGTRTDKDLAKDFGVSPRMVTYYRNLHKIPAWSPWVEHEEKLKPYLGMIGKVSDPKLAKMAGVTTRIVYKYRMMKGIETNVISPSHKEFVPIDRDMIRDLFEKGFSDKYIAKAVGSTPGTVAMIRTQQLGLLRSPRKILSEEEKSKISRIFEECGNNYSETARRAGCTSATVRSLVKKAQE